MHSYVHTIPGDRKAGPDPASVLIDPICDEFERARRAGDDSPLEAWLPADTELRPAVLVELVRVELQLRLAAGVPARAEEYLARFPELGSDPGLALRVGCRVPAAAAERSRPGPG